MKTHYRIILTLMVAMAALCPNPCCALQSESTEANTDSEQAFRSKDDSIPARQTTSEFLRLQTDEFKNPIALQTATTRYVLLDKNGDEELEVILESVIHIADPSYYRGFQKRFERYDSVLYESIIKPQDHQSDEPEPSGGFQILQQLSTGTIGLVYQFDELNHQADNMVHSDLSPNEISERMQERGESATTVFSDLVTHIVQKINAVRENESEDAAENVEGVSEANRQGDEIQPVGVEFNLSVFTDPDGIMKIRRMMANILVGSGLLESPLPPGIHRMVVGDRNENTMSVLDAEIRKGKRRIAIFYGVAHMSDFERRLVSEYGMKKVATNWRNAWDLRDGAIEGAPLEGLVESAFRDSVKEKLARFAKNVGQKKPTEQAVPEPSAKTNKEVEEMEKTLKTLEARLRELENQTKEDKRDQEDDDNMSEDK